MQATFNESDIQSLLTKVKIFNPITKQEEEIEIETVENTKEFENIYYTNVQKVELVGFADPGTKIEIENLDSC